MLPDDRLRRSLLFLPASNPRAIAKARTLKADMLVLDLEDAVAPADKDEARGAAIAALAEGFGSSEAGVRINGAGTIEHGADLTAVAGSLAAFAILPKAERAEDVARVANALRKPLLCMIETPAGVLQAAAIAAVPGVAGLVAGTNDLGAALRLPPSAGRASMSHSLQQVVLAARAAGVLAFDGVFNALDDPPGLEAEAREGRALGFDGKSLIHPGQIEAANRLFGPSEAELEEARALVETAATGAERFRGRMIEALHVAGAERLLRYS